MSLDNAKLLTADEIEERLADTRTTIKDIISKVEILMLSPISDEDCIAQIGKVSKDLRRLKTDFNAYQTALEADPFDYE